MRYFKSLATPLFATTLICLASASAWAQQVRIIYPQEGQDVRGEVTVRYEGLPPGGQAVIRIDGQFKEGTAQEYSILDTISDRNTFSRGDGTYKLNVTVLRPGGGQVGTDTVTFNVANNKVDAGGESVKLSHWVPTDILRDSVERYRVFAESNATIEGGASAGGLGGGPSPGGLSLGGGEGGASGGGSTDIPAPLDWQVAALMRRQVRNIGMYSGSANIATAVQESFERQRKGEGGGGAGGAEGGIGSLGGGGRGGSSSGGSSKKTGSGAPAKAPWNEDDKGMPLWNPGPETGKYFVKMIEPNGTEINATRKAPTIAIADLLPTFPDSEVRPGSTWETNMTILGDLSTRKGVNVTAPITFTAYDTILTPAGESRRCAKLESRFRLPENLSKQIAANLGSKVGSGGASGGLGGASLGGSPGGGAEGGGGGTELSPDDIQVSRTDVARVMWFDMDRRQILRSEDTIKSYFELPAASNGADGAGGSLGGPSLGGRGGPSLGGRGGGFPGAPGGGPDGGAAAAPAEPQKVNYNLNVTTWFDDRIPSPNFTYTGGLGTAHSKDSVNEVGISRITQGARR